MELLTGKAKKSFLIKIYYQEDTNQASDESNIEKIIFHATKWIERQDERFVNALIIDFFDSIGIFISTSGLVLTKMFIMDVSFDTNCEHYEDDFQTRQEATIAGIKKANEIFNSKF